VSTILDALRRLQRERQEDLRDSVLGEDPILPSQPRRGRALLLLVVLLAVVGGVGWFAWPGQERLRAALDFSDEGTATVQAPAPPAEMPAQVAKLEKARRELEERRRATRAAQLQKQGERAKAQQKQAAAPPAPAGKTPEVRPSSAVPGASQAAKTETVNRPPAQSPPGQARARAQAAASATPFLNTPTQETPAPSQRAPRRARAQASAPAAQPRARAPAQTEPALPELDLAFRLEPVPPRPGDSEADASFGAVSADGFPRLTVEQVRWHPAPERRVARILLEDTRPVEAYEGDIIAGVAIHRIDPGAVELRLGDARRRIAIGQ
jgi:hypothetical protein